jgi:HPt (histidine-containing phosphotransfer) domain-containing protein
MECLLMDTSLKPSFEHEPAGQSETTFFMNVIDRSVQDEYVELVGENGKKSLQRLIDIYLATAKDLMLKMEQSTADQNIQELRRSAHTLKSSSGSLGAVHLYDLCVNLEMKARKSIETGEPVEDFDEYRADTLVIRAEYDRVNLALTSILEELKR